MFDKKIIMTRVKFYLAIARGLRKYRKKRKLSSSIVSIKKKRKFF